MFLIQGDLMSIKAFSLLGVANAVVVMGANQLAAKKVIKSETSFGLKAMTITISVIGVLAELYKKLERSEDQQKADKSIIWCVAQLSLVTILGKIAFSEHKKMLEALNRG